MSEISHFADEEDLRLFLVKKGIKPAENENCNVYFVAMSAIDAMEKAFKDLSRNIEQLLGAAEEMTGGDTSTPGGRQ